MEIPNSVRYFQRLNEMVKELASEMKGEKMPKYVDVVPLIERITKLEREALQQTEKYDPLKEPVWWNRWSSILAERTAFKYELIDTPAADVVEVVRCKDCRYMTGHYDMDGNVPYWTCSEWDGGTDYDGYCHFGERKEDDEIQHP